MPEPPVTITATIRGNNPEPHEMSTKELLRLIEKSLNAMVDENRNESVHVVMKIMEN